MTSQIAGLFPTPLLRAPRQLPSDLVATLVQRFEASAAQANHRSGALVHTEILSAADDPALAAVAELALPKLVEFGELLFGERLRWTVKELWANVMQRGGQQALHNHANSLVSGIVYLTPSHSSANTVFVKALGGPGYVFSNSHAQTRQGPFNSDKWISPDAEIGDLLLFPSHVLHEVPANQGDTRITLAFNAVPQRLNAWGYSVGFST